MHNQNAFVRGTYSILQFVISLPITHPLCRGLGVEAPALPMLVLYSVPEKYEPNQYSEQKTS